MGAQLGLRERVHALRNGAVPVRCPMLVDQRSMEVYCRRLSRRTWDSFDTEALFAATMTQRESTENISYLAFTATPKPKTMELFGTADPDDFADDGTPKPKAFRLYSIRQAI